MAARSSLIFAYPAACGLVAVLPFMNHSSQGKVRRNKQHWIPPSKSKAAQDRSPLSPYAMISCKTAHSSSPSIKISSTVKTNRMMRPSPSHPKQPKTKPTLNRTALTRRYCFVTQRSHSMVIAFTTTKHMPARSSTTQVSLCTGHCSLNVLCSWPRSTSARSKPSLSARALH